ncbi:MAG: monovalent cation/H+ antiporter subunit D [Paracoccaceae bacterium]
MNLSPEHLIIAPILIPLVAGALMLLYEDRQRRAKMVISLVSSALLLLVAVQLMVMSKGSGPSDANRIGLYLLGDWPSPFGIVLVLDRLSALMLVLVALLATPALVYSAAGWHRQGQHFHSLFQFLLMGLNGAFLTGDLFNLFVFFEVLLAASYGLLLHGTGQARVRMGLHYIAINLAASLLFLIGVSLIYGVTGTLNMAELAAKLPDLADADRPMVHAAAALLGIAFLVKAGMWPLSFWLPGTYMAASAPVGAMFAIMTKVGIYVVLRLSSLLFGDGHLSSGFGAEVLMIGGIGTILFGLTGVLASQRLGRMAGNLVLVSTGTMLTVIGMGLDGASSNLIAAGLFYMVSSTVATSALFLLMEPLERESGGIAALLALTADAYGIDEAEDDTPEVGLAIPGALTVLGGCFVGVVLLLAGLPPLSGFVGKVAMLTAAMNPEGLNRLSEITPQVWAFAAVLLMSGLATMVALVRVGIQTFWVTAEEELPRVLALELGPVVALLLMAVTMTVQAEPVMRYMTTTAMALDRPQIYVGGVIRAARVGEAIPPAAPPAAAMQAPAEGAAP